MRIDDCLAGVKTVGITGHVRPDGDCTGSCLGLYNYIKDNYSQIDVDIYLEQPGAEFNYLTGIDSIKNEPEDKIYDLFFVLDCSSFDRIQQDEEKRKEIEAFAETEDIDPKMLGEFISEYEFSGTMEAGDIRDRIDKPMPLLKKKSLVNRIVDFVLSHVEKYQ